MQSRLLLGERYPLWIGVIGVCLRLVVSTEGSRSDASSRCPKGGKGL